MNICVAGLWHLGSVTAACLAHAGNSVIGLDPDKENVERLGAGTPPIAEPGLAELIKEGLYSNRLSFTTDSSAALADAEVVWITYDTPVDADDNADVEYVLDRVKELYAGLNDGTIVIISSQLPVGSTRVLEEALASEYPDKKVSFAASPENLRLGKAISVFTNPDRVIVGVREGTKDNNDKERIAKLLEPFTDNIVWMRVESAEMTKHAINSFLALSVTFANEIATISELSGADAKEVEKGLKSESRIGPGAYVAPGVAFAGGTLARDISFLTSLGGELNLPVELLKAVRKSNNHHKLWVGTKLKSIIGDLSGKTIAVLGLTYKPGTDTLRRSSAVELCTALTKAGAKVLANDPAIKELPPELAAEFTLCSSPLEAMRGAAALVIATEWLDFKSITAEEVVTIMENPVVVDPNRFLAGTLSEARINYSAVGSPADASVTKGEPA
ncbi:MAG: nucleotide sugar dehydrogenase [Thermodesulfobacteriota bacterium]